MSQHDPQSVGAPPPPPMTTPTSKDENMWAMFAHLGGLVGFVIPYCGFVGPLVVWLIQKDKMPLVDDQGKEAVNFQIGITIGWIISSPLVLAFGLGVLMILAISIFDLVMIVIATIKANAGERYRYPLCIRFIK